MRDGEVVAVEPVAAHQQPSRQAFADDAAAVGERRIAGLDHEDVHVAHDHRAKRRQPLHGGHQFRALDPPSLAFGLYEVLVRRAVDTERDRRRPDTVPAVDADFEPALARRDRDHRGEAVGGKVDVVVRHVGFGEHEPARPGDLLQIGLQAFKIVRRQQGEQAVLRGWAHTGSGAVLGRGCAHRSVLAPTAGQGLPTPCRVEANQSIFRMTWSETVPSCGAVSAGHFALIRSLIRPARSSIAKGFVITCMPGSSGPSPRIALSP